MRNRVAITGIKLHPKLVDVIVRYTIDAINELPRDRRARFADGAIVPANTDAEVLEELRLVYPMGKYLSAIRAAKLHLRYKRPDETLRPEDRAALMQARTEAARRRNYALMQAIDRCLQD